MLNSFVLALLVLAALQRNVNINVSITTSNNEAENASIENLNDDAPENSSNVQGNPNINNVPENPTNAPENPVNYNEPINRRRRREASDIIENYMNPATAPVRQFRNNMVTQELVFPSTASQNEREVSYLPVPVQEPTNPDFPLQVQQEARHFIVTGRVPQEMMMNHYGWTQEQWNMRYRRAATTTASVLYCPLFIEAGIQSGIICNGAYLSEDQLGYSRADLYNTFPEFQNWVNFIANDENWLTAARNNLQRSLIRTRYGLYIVAATQNALMESLPYTLTHAINIAALIYFMVKAMYQAQRSQ